MTLDEVIEAMEYCSQPMPKSLCCNCPTKEKASNCNVYNNAIQYLKEYRNHLHSELDMLRQKKLDYENEMKFIDHIHNIVKAIRG